MSSEIKVVETWPEPAHLQDDASSTAALVQRYLPGFSPKLEFDLQHHWWSFTLPCPSEAEYQFTLAGELGGERQIGASPKELTQKNHRRRFWYSPLEMADFRDDATALERSFHERVIALLTH